MKIQANFSALKQTKPHEHILRFVLGGLVTALAGLVADWYGPVVGGLFLAFPSIFPAAITLISKHQEQKKQQQGLQGADRGRQAASLDAFGAALGSFGLLAFALVLWRLLPHHGAVPVLALATVAWMLVAGSLWYPTKGPSPSPLPGSRTTLVRSSRRRVKPCATERRRRRRPMEPPLHGMLLLPCPP